MANHGLRYVPIQSVLEEYDTYSGGIASRYDEEQILKYADDAIQKAIPTNQLEYIVDLLYVQDHKAEMPKNLDVINQIAYRSRDAGGPQRRIKRTELIQWTQNAFDGSGCEYVVTKECPKCLKKGDACDCRTQEVIIDVDRIWDLNHPQMRYKHLSHLHKYGGIGNETNWVPTSPYNSEFQLMKPASHNFFSPDSYIPGCLNLNEKLLANQTVEYKISNGVLTTNLKDGDIILSYMGQRVDEDGWHMVPDDSDVFMLINFWLDTMFLRREARLERDSFKYQLYQDANANRIQKLREVREKYDQPGFDEWMNYLDNVWKRNVPRDNPHNEMNMYRGDSYHRNMRNL